MYQSHQIIKQTIRKLEDSPIISITGMSTGDEGKGRAVKDLVNLLQKLRKLKDPVHMVYKVNGGSNSGHTVDGLVHNLIPGGVTDPNIRFLALGRGVVADPKKLNWELTILKNQLEPKGIEVSGRLKIDNRTMVSDLTDRLLDLAGELALEKKTGQKRGSTGRGIAPAFTHEADHSQIFFETLVEDPGAFAEAMQKRIDHACIFIKDSLKLTENDWYSLFDKLTTTESKAHATAIDEGIFPASEFDFTRYITKEPFKINAELLIHEYLEVGKNFSSDVLDVGELALEVIGNNRQIIAEHGQSYGLDKRHGFTPFSTTSSHTYTPEVWESLNLPSQLTAYIVGVSKAYDTKVGNHVFLTEIEEGHPLGDILKKIEFGATTGRQRMVGWSDLVEKAYTLRRGGSDDLVFNKLDVLTANGDWQGPLKLCVAYKDPEGHQYQTVPSNNNIRKKLKPVYLELPVWQEDISDSRSFTDLPEAAQDYIAVSYQKIVEIAMRDGHRLPGGLPTLRFVGVGPNPDQIISDLPDPKILIRRSKLLTM